MSKYAQLGIIENNITFSQGSALFPTQQVITPVTFDISYAFDNSAIIITNRRTAKSFRVSLLICGFDDVDAGTKDVTQEIINTFSKPSLVITTGFSAKIH